MATFDSQILQAVSVITKLEITVERRKLSMHTAKMSKHSIVYVDIMSRRSL
jgi:hypothetical protein